MSESESVRTSKWIWIGLAVVVALGAYLRAYDLGGPSFDQDELYAVRITGLSPKTLASVIARDGLKTNHPPLMTVPFLLWTALFGTSEAAVRALPCLAGVLAIPVVFRLGQKLSGPRAGLIAAVVLAINPLHITYSQEARQYAVLVLLVAISHLLMLKCLARGKWYDLLAYLAVSTVALLTHYFAAPALLSHLAIGVWLLFSRDVVGRAAGLRLITTLGLAGLSLAAWLPMAGYQSTMKWGHLTEVSPGGMGESFGQLAGVGWPGAWIYVAAAVVGWMMLFGVYVHTSPQREQGEDQAPLLARRACEVGPLPRWFGFIACLSGILAIVGSLTVIPAKLFPIARKALENYQYDAATIDTELNVIASTFLGYSIAFTLFGLVIAFWRPVAERVVRVLGKIAFVARPLSSGVVVAALIAVPFLIVGTAALLGIPVFSVRNMIVVGPAVAVGLGITGEALLQRSWSGRIVFAIFAALVIGGVTRYETVTAPFGVPGGPRLGLDTPDWKAVVAALPPELPIVVVNHPTTDPLLHYAANRSPIRVKAEGPFDKLPPRFVYVHWPSRADSTAVLSALKKQGCKVESEREVGELRVLVLLR